MAVSLRSERGLLAATHIGNYALFGGGGADSNSPGTFFNQVDAYNKSLSRSSAPNLSVARRKLGGTHVGDYALFAGGECKKSSSSYESSAVVDAYSTALTRTTPSPMSAVKYTSGGSHINNYALFAGQNALVEVYDSSLTRLTPIDFGMNAGNVGGTHIGDYVIFNGGNSNVNTAAYDSSLTKVNITNADNMYMIAATHIGNYALFGGGNNYPPYGKVNTYDASLTKSDAPEFGAYYQLFAGAAHSNTHAIFFGGNTGNSQTARMIFYDESLTKSSPVSLSDSGYLMQGTNVGDFTLLGGFSSKSTIDVVYTISRGTSIAKKILNSVYVGIILAEDKIVRV